MGRLAVPIGVVLVTAVIGTGDPVLWYKLPVLLSLVQTKFRHAFNLVHSTAVVHLSLCK